MNNQIDIVELVKERNHIEDVIAADGYPLEGHGRYRRARQHDSLVVDVHNQAYFWNSKSESGDVISWIQRRTNTDFKGAIENLCRRAGLPDPNWEHESSAQRMITRAREDTFQAACGVFSRWLFKNDAALAYAHSRGWNDDALKDARIGYTGGSERGTGLRDELLKELIAANVDVDGPAAVALLGFHGDVAKWASAHGVEPMENWVRDGRITGLIGQDMLVYPHIKSGRVVYYSARSIKEKRHYNLPEALVGPRQIYLNHKWSSHSEECVIVEGQADALSLAQLEIPAIALAGVSTGNELNYPGKKDGVIFYVGLDADQAGTASKPKLANLIGPLCRMLVWSIDPALAGVDIPEIKDANDVLRAMQLRQVEPDDQGRWMRKLMINAKTYVEVMAEWAGSQEGAAKDVAQRKALDLIRRMDDMSLAQYRSRLAKALDLSLRDLSNMLKVSQSAQDNGGPEGEPEYTFGGFIQGWLIEYLYDPESERAMLAWRDPDGNIGSGDQVIIDGKRYLPEIPNNTVKRGAIPFPSRVGDAKNIRELVAYIEMYLKSVMILPGTRMTKLISYYVLLTWVYDMFETVMYLRAMGSAGSGKSEIMRRIGLICYRTMAANGAGSTSSLFRAVERYRCTVFIDEADIQGSDTENDMIKFYNLGAMRGNPIWRTEKIVIDGRETFEEVGFQTFCPKLVAMRKDFKDDAVGSRSLTLRLQPREMTELMAANIPLTLNDEMREKALALQNLLLRWRLKTWRPTMEVNPNYYDMTINARLNQVAGPLLSLSAEDPDQQEEIKRELRKYYQESILSQSMTLTARLIEALWKIYKYPDLHQQMVKVEPDGQETIKIGDVTRIANEIMDEMNETGDEGEEEDDSGKKKKYGELKPHRVGRMLREDLQLQVTERRRDGFSVFWNGPRLEGLAMRFGVKPETFGPQTSENMPSKKSEPTTGPGPKEEQSDLFLGGSKDD